MYVTLRKFAFSSATHHSLSHTLLPFLSSSTFVHSHAQSYIRESRILIQLIVSLAIAPHLRTHRFFYTCFLWLVLHSINTADFLQQS